MSLARPFDLPADDGRGARLKQIADGIPTDELLDVLARHFGWAQSDPTGGVVYTAASAPRLSLVIRDGVVEAVRTHAALTDVELAEIEAKVVDACLEDAGVVLQSAILLSSLPMHGFYRAPGDVFQISPAPPDAPRPPAVYGDHPFVFQYWSRLSRDQTISIHRSWKAVTEWLWFLNAVLTDRLSPAAGGRSPQRWALSVDWEDPRTEPRNSTWVQDGYYYVGWQPPDSFVPLGPPIPVIESSLYYSRFGNAEDRMELPSSLDGRVLLFLDLDSKRRDRFLRAAQWLTAAIDLSGLHRGSAYVAQVAAIETLAYDPKPERRCETCGRDLNQRPTADFKAFVERYAPGGGSRRDVERLYDVRSGLVHGRSLLYHDSPFGMHVAFATDELNLLQRLNRIVSAVMVNWLLDPSP